MSEERKRVLTMLAEGKITVDEAERLLRALNGSAEAEGSAAPSEGGRRKYKYLRVHIEGGPNKEMVNIRVPLQLIRAGLKLSALMPEHARGKMNDALERRGIDPDSLDPKTFDEVVESLADLSVNLDNPDGGETVRIFCE